MTFNTNKLNQQIWNLTKPCLTSLKAKSLGINSHVCDDDSGIRKLTIIYLGHSISIADCIDRNYVVSNGEDKQIHQVIRNARKFIINDLWHLSGIALRQQCIKAIINIKRDFKGLSNLLIINPTYNYDHITIA